MDDKETKKKLNLFETFTKAWVTVLMVIALIDLQLSYILAFIGRVEIAESLSVAIVTEIIGVMGIYLIRAWLDSATESKHGILRDQMGIEEDDPISDEDEYTETDDDNAEG